MSREADSIDAATDLRRAFTALSEDAVPTAACPPAESLWEAARGESSGDVRDLIEHVATCGACAESWRLARELEPDDGSLSQQQPVTPKPWWSGSTVPAIAAAAMVLLVLSLTWRPSVEDPADTFRGGGQEQIARLPQDGGRLSRAEPVLRWKATEGARYDLVVMDEELAVTVSEAPGLDVAEYRIPAAALSQIPAGTKLFWRVDVETAEGETSALPMYSFTLD